jgi:hypothetical protein
MTYVIFGAAAGDQAGAGPLGLNYDFLGGSRFRVSIGAPGGDGQRGYVYRIDSEDFRAADLSDGTLDGRIALTAFPEDPDDLPDWIRSMYLGAAEGDGIGTISSDVALTQGVPLADPGGRTDAGSVYEDLPFNGAADLAAPAAGGPTYYRFDGADAGDAAGSGLARVGAGVAIGAPGADGLGRADAGIAYLIDDDAYANLDAQDGTVDGVIDLVHAEGAHSPSLPEERYYTLIGEAAGDGAGSTVDDDGSYLTIAAQGADGAAPGSTDAGAVYLIHGDDIGDLDGRSDGGTGSSILASWPATEPTPGGRTGNPTSCWGRPAATVWAPFCTATS